MVKKTDYIVSSDFSNSAVGTYEKGDTANLTKEEAKQVSMFLVDYKEDKPEATPNRSASTKKESVNKGVIKDG